MTFYFIGKDGRRKMERSEVEKRLTWGQIIDALDAKIADPLEEVAFMDSEGWIVLESD